MSDARERMARRVMAIQTPSGGLLSAQGHAFPYVTLNRDEADHHARNLGSGFSVIVLRGKARAAALRALGETE